MEDPNLDELGQRAETLRIVTVDSDKLREILGYLCVEDVADAAWHRAHQADYYFFLVDDAPGVAELEGEHGTA